MRRAGGAGGLGGAKLRRPRPAPALAVLGDAGAQAKSGGLFASGRFSCCRFSRVGAWTSPDGTGNCRQKKASPASRLPWGAVAEPGPSHRRGPGSIPPQGPPPPKKSHVSPDRAWPVRACGLHVCALSGGSRGGAGRRRCHRWELGTQGPGGSLPPPLPRPSKGDGRRRCVSAPVGLWLSPFCPAGCLSQASCSSCCSAQPQDVSTTVARTTAGTETGAQGSRVTTRTAGRWALDQRHFRGLETDE